MAVRDRWLDLIAQPQEAVDLAPRWRDRAELLLPPNFGNYTPFSGRGAPSVEPNERGQGFLFDGSDDCLQRTGIAASGYPYCFVGLARFANVTTNNVLSSIGAITTASNRVQIDVNAGNLRFINVGSSTQTAQVAAAVNTWYGIVATGRSATDRALFVNGQRVSTSTTSSTFSAAWTGVVFGANANNSIPTGGQFINARAGLLAWLPAFVTDDEAATLSNNPWALFEPQRIWVPVTAGGATATVSPTGIASAEAFGTATLTRSQVASATATGIASAEAFGTATLTRTGLATVSPTGIASEEAFGTAALTRIQVSAVTATGIASAEAFGTATVSRVDQQSIVVTGIASAEAFGTPVASLIAGVVPTGIASSETFGTATFTKDGVPPPAVGGSSGLGIRLGVPI